MKINMRYIIGVIIGEGNDIYDKMREVWIYNILMNASDDMELYFIYGSKEGKSVERVVGDVYNFYGKKEELFGNIISKTLDFMEYIDNKYDDYMLVRSNVSTLFNLMLLRYYMNAMSIYRLCFGGTIAGIRIKDINYGIISGTNMCISRDIVKKCIANRYMIDNSSFCDDVLLSRYILNDVRREENCIILCNMGRIDFVENNIMELQHCNSGYNVCCFRFKSDNREKDVERMYELLNAKFDARLLDNWSKRMEIVKYNNMDTLTIPFRYDGDWLNNCIMDKN